MLSPFAQLWAGSALVILTLSAAKGKNPSQCRLKVISTKHLLSRHSPKPEQILRGVYPEREIKGILPLRCAQGQNDKRRAQDDNLERLIARPSTAPKDYEGLLPSGGTPPRGGERFLPFPRKSDHCAVTVIVCAALFPVAS